MIVKKTKTVTKTVKNKAGKKKKFILTLRSYEGFEGGWYADVRERVEMDEAIEKYKNS